MAPLSPGQGGRAFAGHAATRCRQVSERHCQCFPHSPCAGSKEEGTGGEAEGEVAGRDDGSGASGPGAWKKKLPPSSTRVIAGLAGLSLLLRRWIAGAGFEWIYVDLS